MRGEPDPVRLEILHDDFLLFQMFDSDVLREVKMNVYTAHTISPYVWMHMKMLIELGDIRRKILGFGKGSRACYIVHCDGRVRLLEGSKQTS